MATTCELYEWTDGPVVVRETDARTPQTKDGQTYAPSTLRRSALDFSTSLDAAKTTITVHRTHEIALRYRTLPPDGVALAISRGSGSSWSPLWSGRLSAVRWQGDQAELDVEPPQTALRLRGLHQTFSAHCRHRLGDARCGLVIHQRHLTHPGLYPLFVDLTVAAVAGDKATITGLSSFVDGASAHHPLNGPVWFFGGELVHMATSRRRFITSHVDDELTLHAHLPDVSPGDAVQLLAGCAHAIHVCEAKFKNLSRFGGFAFTPNTNPFLVERY